MLINRRDYLLFQPEVVRIMSDAAIAAKMLHTNLLELSHQAELLGNGLQNAAPADRAGTPNLAVAYLLTTAEMIKNTAEKCDALASEANPAPPRKSI